MRLSPFSQNAKSLFGEWGGEVLMTDEIFKSLLGSKILPQRRGMEQGDFQSLDGIQNLLQEVLTFF